MDGRTFHLSQGDAVAWLRQLPSESIDLVVTDPPYESLEKHRAIGTTTRLKHSKASSNDWFSIFPNERFPELFAEVHRVLKRNTHFYLYCDPETMFVAKPIAEEVGFKFWKPLIWDKCLGPDTLVWTERGVTRIDDVVPGDRVAIPEGGTTEVRATRRTRAEAVRIHLSDGTSIVASREHRFVLPDGRQVEAASLSNEPLLTRAVRQRVTSELRLDELIPESEAVCALPDVSSCLWCGAAFDSSGAAAAHQARFCTNARSKLELAAELGLAPERLHRWMSNGRLPLAWARRLGLADKLGDRVPCYLQDDAESWFPRTLELDHECGRLVGLYAAEGSSTDAGVKFTFRAEEKHLHDHIARFARALGVRARVEVNGNTRVVQVDVKIMKYLLEHFVGGSTATTRYLKPAVYAAPEEFRRGVLAGINEGDGSWSHDEQRDTFTTASADLAMFVRRELASQDYVPAVSRFENEHAGGWRVRHDPIRRNEPIAVVSVEPVGVCDLVDISIADRDELFLLGNGVVTHNCKIGMGYHYRARYECILFFEKGKRKLNDLGTADIIEVKRVNGGYPAEKPPAVSEVLIRQSTEPGQLVIDPFMGSGSVGVAAMTLGRAFLGNDLCAEAVDITRSRLRDGGGHEATAAPSSQIAQLGQLGLGLSG